ncbi:unnamed protein product [Ixodes hexagonus]
MGGPSSLGVPGPLAGEFFMPSRPFEHKMAELHPPAEDMPFITGGPMSGPIDPMGPSGPPGPIWNCRRRK